ncbi:MAG: endoplasmic reticulum-golgi intermediate compartment protein 3-like protein [Piptocephalis tieghemiana]|nr:MAG: endoplasmic reticulum-golgi intermediate compartment protein 3-like protein [Piptocephalis tieghemiana]
MAKGGPPMLNKLQQFDAYAKTLEDFRVKTSSGALLTLASAGLIVILLLSEFAAYRAVQLRPSMSVDPVRKERLTINLNMTMPKIPCYLLNLHVMDDAGEDQMDTSHVIFKTRIDASGQRIDTTHEPSLLTKGKSKKPQELVHLKDKNYCGSCYGGTPPKSGCCNTCEDIKDAYTRKGWAFHNGEGMEQCANEGYTERIKEMDKEGCNIHGRVEVNKVSGNVHFALGETYISPGMHIHDLTPFLSRDFDFSHHVHTLSFGEDLPGVTNPLDGHTELAPPENAYFQYYIKVVGTKAVYLDGRHVRSNQFSVTQHTEKLTGNHKMPGLFFNYDISPMLITYTETRMPFTHFLTSACAIVGGVFTVASILDSIIYNAERNFRRKRELGKQV